MEMIDAGQVKERMNRAGRAHVPFVFGVDFELTEGFFVENPLQQEDILFEAGGITNAPRGKQALFSRAVTGKSFHGDALEGEFAGKGMTGKRVFDRCPISFGEYQDKFNVVRRGLRRGDSFLLNLTVATRLDMDWTLEEIFYLSRSPYRLLLPGRLVCFSPEIFVRIGQGEISSFPMKGTIDAAVPDAEEVLLNDYKEKSEHNTIVDLIRNDLNRVSGEVSVRRFRYVDRLRTSNGEILQASSEVVGKLPEGYADCLGDIVFNLLPAGSISGAPKPSTLEIIARAEGEKRGFYTGVFGYFDGERLDSAVMIRYIEKRDGEYYFRSGGGVTINSDCRSEYEEVLEKVYLPFGG